MRRTMGLAHPLYEHAERARDWLLSAAYPLWFAKGVDWEKGGFFDALDMENRCNVAPIKRLRVAARQIFVFSQAVRMGFKDGDRAVEHGLKFLFNSAIHPDGAFTSSFDLQCHQISEDRDTYDLSFVLFALAHAYRLSGDKRCRIEAEKLLNFFDVRLRHPLGGFVEGVPFKKPRRQNPHMHLFEACLSWLPFDTNGRFRSFADELALLLETAFLNTESGAISEYFSESLQRYGSDVQEAVEPGHLYEWLWLLDTYSRSTNRQMPFLSSIYAFTERYGKNADTGLLYGELDCSGAIRDYTVRLWPHAEWVRAELTYFKVQCGDKPTRLENALSALWRFIDAPTQGLWFERYDALTKGFKQEPVAASSLYHIVGAFSALIETVSNEV